MRASILLATLLLLGALAPTSADAAVITIINNDSAGEGFNDPTPATPVGGNPGVTVGQQRLAVFQEAARIWGRRLDSNVTILVQANFDPLPCGTSSGVLGAASPLSAMRDFGSGSIAGTWYVIAQANAMAGSDLRTDIPDIVAQFQSNLGTAGCLPSLTWYYGLDGNEGAGQTDLLATVLHELGHGLGFLSLVDESTGARFGGFIDIFSRFLFDNDSKKSWDAMSDGERVASAVNDGNLVWTGSHVSSELTDYLDDATVLEIPSGSLSGTFEAAAAAFGPALTSGGVSGELVLVSDSSGTPTDLCDTITNGAEVNGNIAVIDRGTCAFTDKVFRAQQAGATAAVVINNVSGAPFSMTGNNGSINIPAVMIRLEDGNALKAELAGNSVTATVRLDPSRRAGADASGRLRLYAPGVVAPGSSVSHWDVVASPNLLMEPFISSTLGPEVDLTRATFWDLGWPLNPVPAATVSGLRVARTQQDAVLRWQGTDLGADTRVAVHRQPSDGNRAELAVLTPAQVERGEYVDTDPPQEGADYWLRLSFGSGELAWVGPVSLPATGAAALQVAAIQPNPFEGEGRLSFALPASGRVLVTLHDLRGRRVALLEDQVLEAGRHQMTLDGRDEQGRPLAAGVYFARVQYLDQVRTQKIVLTR